MSSNTALVAALAFAVTKSLRSSIAISRPTVSVILSVTSRHFCRRPYGSLFTIVLEESEFSTLFRYFISLRVFLHPVSAIENLFNASLSSSLIVGPFACLSTYAVALSGSLDHISSLRDFGPRDLFRPLSSQGNSSLTP